MTHAIVDIEKINHEAASVVSVQHTADMDNGVVAHVGDFVSGEGELRQVVIPTTASITSSSVVLVKSPEIQGAMYEPYSTLQDFYNAANRPATAFRLRAGDQFKITTDGFDGTAAVDSYLIPQNNSLRLAVAADLSGNTVFAAKILQTGLKSGYTGTGWAKKDAILVEVVKN
jgi:hypothetical protein